MTNATQEFTELLTDRLDQIAEAFLEAAEGDRVRFAEAMAEDLAAATLMGDQAVIDEILGQAKALAEKHRVSLSDSAWGLFIESAGGTVQLITLALRIARGLI